MADMPDNHRILIVFRVILSQLCQPRLALKPVLLVVTVGTEVRSAAAIFPSPLDEQRDRRCDAGSCTPPGHEPVDRASSKKLVIEGRHPGALALVQASATRIWLAAERLFSLAHSAVSIGKCFALETARMREDLEHRWYFGFATVLSFRPRSPDFARTPSSRESHSREGLSPAWTVHC